MGQPPTTQRRVAPGDDAETDFSLLRELWLAFRDVFADFERAVGVSRPRVMLLGALARLGELSQADLQQLLDVDGSNITRHVKALEAEGLLTRRDDPRDNRFTLVSLTAAGRTTAEEFVARAHAHESGLLAEMSADEAANIHRGLRRLRAAAGGPGIRGDAARSPD